MLEKKDIITHKGSIIDATFVTVPKRHTTKTYNKHLKKGEEFQKLLLEKFPNLKIHVYAKAYRNTLLTNEDKVNNKIIAHISARIEHIFGYMTRFMAGITSRVHGLARVMRDVCAKNLAYNIKRYVFIAG